MDWFNSLFFIALLVALLTETAYFRGFVKRKENPKRYWSIVACYALLASMGLLKFFRIPFTNLISDAATRIAYDIEAETQSLSKTNSSAYTIQHKPTPWPDGCPHGYKVQFSKASALLVWCMDSPTALATSSHSTTYHLRFVDVPETFMIDKAKGEMLFIDVEKHGARPSIVRLR